MSYLKRRSRSFVYALKGVAALVRTQPNARIHLAATVAVAALGCWFSLDRLEWALVIVAVMTVWVAEGINTAIEALADVVSPDRHPLIARAKDVAAAAVLIAAVGAIFIGFLVFAERLRRLFSG